VEDRVFDAADVLIDRHPLAASTGSNAMLGVKGSV